MKARAVRIREPGDPNVLDIGEIEVRDPGPGEIAVNVIAAGLNRADLLQRRGVYPPPPGCPADVPGLEYAGTIAAVGLGVDSARISDRVMGIIGGGGMATRVVVHEREALPIPAVLEFTEAAAIPEVFLTAFDALFNQAELRLGETVLIHAVGSGVGTALVQLARATGAITIGTSRTSDKVAKADTLGLTHGIVVEDSSFAARVQELTDGAGADVIVDPIGASYLEENLTALALKGRLVIYGTMGGFSGELAIAQLLSKRARIIGTVLRSRPLEEKIALAQRFTRDVVPLFAAEVLRPVIADVLPMSDVRSAHERLEKNDSFGKIVLTWEEA